MLLKHILCGVWLTFYELHILQTIQSFRKGNALQDVTTPYNYDYIKSVC